MKKLYIIVLLALLLLLLYTCTDEAATRGISLPKAFPSTAAIDRIEYDFLGGHKGESNVRVIDDRTLHVSIRFRPDDPVQQDDWRVSIIPGFTPTFHWDPHLAPTDEHIIEQHVFRSPALIAADEQRVITMIPDLDILGRGTPVRWYLDMDALENRLVLGMSNSRVDDHVLFV